LVFDPFIVARKSIYSWLEKTVFGFLARQIACHESRYFGFRGSRAI